MLLDTPAAQPRRYRVLVRPLDYRVSLLCPLPWPRQAACSPSCLPSSAQQFVLRPARPIERCLPPCARPWLQVRLVGYEPQDPALMCHPADACGLPGGRAGRWLGGCAVLGTRQAWHSILVCTSEACFLPAAVGTKKCSRPPRPALPWLLPAPAPTGPSSSTTGAWVYTVRLRLEDATGQLDACVFGPDGAQPAAARQV